jgi:glycosyltransferase involved in cell wall biosynthesis
MHAGIRRMNARDERLSVMLFTHCEVRGGAEEHMLMLAKGMDQRYFRVCLACPPALAERFQPDVPSHVELIPIPLTKPTHFSAMLQLGRVLRERRIDILHSHIFFSSLLASPIAWLSRVPVIVESAHGREAWRRGWKDHYYIDRMIGRFVDAYIAVSAANARYLSEVKGYPSRKVSVIHPGSDLSRFDPSREVPAGLKESLGFSASDPVIVMVGRLEPQKGHRILLEAMPAVCRQFPNVRLVCAGEGVLRGQLERQTESLGLCGAVRFIGYPKDIRDWLAMATLTVLPSFYEGLPVTPIESLACLRPVIATNVDGTPDVIIDGKTGLTVPAGDPVRLAEAICTLLGDPALREKLARQGNQWVTENFTVEQMTGKIQRFYWNVWRQFAGKQAQGRRISMPATALTSQV